MFDIIKQIEEIIIPYQAISSELSEIQLLKKVLLGNHAAYFSCAFLRLNLKTMQHSSNELLSAVRLLKQASTVNMSSKK